MLKPKIKVKIKDNISGEQFEYKIGAYIPDYGRFDSVYKEYIAEFDTEDALFIYRMIKLNMMYPCNELIRKKSVDWQGIIENGFADSTIILNNAAQTKELSEDKDEINLLVSKAVYYKNEFDLNMSMKAYINFRKLILDEMEYVDSELDTMLNKTLKDTLKKMGTLKSFKAKILKKKEVNQAVNDTKKSIYKMVFDKTAENEAQISDQEFYIRASKLLEHFDNKEYRRLINDVINYFSSWQNKNYYSTQIEALQDALHGNKKDKINSLDWITENTFSRIEAFNYLRMEAEDIFLDILNWFHKKEYRRLRNKMTYPEKRVYQLLFLRRNAFGHRIPVLEPLFQSFIFKSDDRTKELLIMVLLLKKNHFEGKNLRSELLFKWKQYIRIYPNLVDNEIGYIEVLLDKEKCLKFATRICNDKELDVVKWYLQSFNLELTSLKAGMRKEDLIKFLSDFIEKMKHEVGNNATME